MLLTAGFLGFLICSAATDLLQRRLPNRLTAAGCFIGFAIHLYSSGWSGAAFSAAGAVAAFAVTLPLWLLKAVGAGDVKWFAAAGAWLGAPGSVGLAIGSILVSAGIAVAYSIVSPTFRRGCRDRLWLVVAGLRTDSMSMMLPPSEQRGRFPFMAAVLPTACAFIAHQGGVAGAGGWT